MKRFLPRFKTKDKRLVLTQNVAEKNWGRDKGEHTENSDRKAHRGRLVLLVDTSNSDQKVRRTACGPDKFEEADYGQKGIKGRCAVYRAGSGDSCSEKAFTTAFIVVESQVVERPFEC